TQFTTPEGRDPVFIRMTGMGKGMMFIDGNNIGHQWMSYLFSLGKPIKSKCVVKPFITITLFLGS
ncbi:beta-galactosidase, partial [Stylosanthes scabra]|nr:beta-galactosidase [Stylosanthes scabra]